MKESHARISQTISFIRKATVTPAAAMDRRKGVADALQEWFDARGPAVDTVSAAMSQNKTRNRPSDADDRHYRRAIILIKCVAYPAENRPDEHAANVNNVIKSNYAAALGQALIEAGQDLQLTSPTGLNEVYNLLLANPERFLTEKTIRINVASGVEGELEYAFYYHTGGKRYEFASIAYAGVRPHKKVMVTVVPAINWWEIPGYPKEVVPTVANASGSPPLVITTQFTGCTFCYAPNGGGLLAAHVSPDGTNKDAARAKTGKKLGEQLTDDGNSFKGYGAFKTYVRGATEEKLGYGDTEQMYIIGVHGRNGWECWSQHVWKTSKDVIPFYP